MDATIVHLLEVQWRLFFIVNESFFNQGLTEESTVAYYEDSHLLIS